MTTQRASSQSAVRTNLLLSQKMISRRAALSQLVGLALAGGSIVQFASSCGSASPSSAPSSPTLGTVFYTYHGHTNGVTSVTWSPDGKRIASGSHDDTVQVWETATGEHVINYCCGHSASVTSVTWSPDGKRIASGSYDGTAQVWDAAIGEHVYTYRGHSASVLAVAWSPDGKRIASGSSDMTVQIWQV